MKKIAKWIILFTAVSAITLAGCGSSAKNDTSGSSAGASSSASAESSSAPETVSGTSSEADQAPAEASASSVSEEQPDTESASAVIPTPQETPFPELTEEPEETEAPVTPAPEEESNIQEDLGVILTEIAENVHTGEAGSSLKSTAVAADVLDFTMMTSLTADQIHSQTERYLEALPEEQQLEFPDQVMFTGEAIHTLKDGDGQAMLEDAGVTDCGYPWTADAYEKADALLQGAGI